MGEIAEDRIQDEIQERTVEYIADIAVPQVVEELVQLQIIGKFGETQSSMLALVRIHSRR